LVRRRTSAESTASCDRIKSCKQSLQRESVGYDDVAVKRGSIH